MWRFDSGVVDVLLVHCSGGNLCLTLEGGKAGGLGEGSPPSGVQRQSPGGGSGERSSSEAVSFSVYSGPKIPCFVKNNVLYEFVSVIV